jgi:hypothetical protein
MPLTTLMGCFYCCCGNETAVKRASWVGVRQPVMMEIYKAGPLLQKRNTTPEGIDGGPMDFVCVGLT